MTMSHTPPSWVQAFNHIVVTHHLLVPSGLLQTLHLPSGQRRMFVHLERMFMTTMQPPFSFSDTSKQTEQLHLIQLAQVLLSHTTCQDDLPSEAACAAHWHYLREWSMWFAAFMLGLDERADLWGEPLVLDIENQQALASRAMRYHEDMVNVMHMSYADFYTRIEAFDMLVLHQQSQDFLDQLVLRHHMQCLQWMVTACSLHLTSMGRSDRLLLSDFIMRASVAIVLLDQQDDAHFMTDDVHRGALEKCCADINRLWAKPRFQALLHQLCLTRDQSPSVRRLS